MYDVLVIGAGIVGSLITRELTKYKLNVACLEKENDVGNGVTNSNSAIIHSGYDPKPGTLKAKFNVLANPMFDQLLDDLDVHYSRPGSLTVAIYDEQLETLKELEVRSKENNVPVTLLSAEEVIKLEPNINPNVKGALFAPTAGIVDVFNFPIHAMENAVDNGAKLFLNEEVINIIDKGEYYIVKTNNNEYEAKVVINAAGLGSEKIARMVDDIDWKLTPRKGEYYVLDHYQEGLVNHTIFPLPSEKGKGTLVTMTTSGNYLVGPSSEYSDADDFSTDLLTLANIKKQTTDLVPNIPFNQVVRTFAGVRPSSTRHDFIIESVKGHDNFIQVAGIESPGLASSPAIAKYVVEELISKVIKLENNNNFNPKVKKYINMKSLSIEERNQIIANDKDYGDIVCNCEQVSMGEIKELFTRSVPPHTLKGIKRRVRAGFGKCQGGFCSSKVLFELAKEYNLNPTDILWDKDNSEILIKKVKEGK